MPVYKVIMHRSGFRSIKLHVDAPNTAAAECKAYDRLDAVMSRADLAEYIVGSVQKVVEPLYVDAQGAK